MRSKVQVEAIVKGFITYLSDQKAIDLLPEVAQELLKQSWVRVDPNLATVTSSVKLSRGQVKEIKNTLAQHFNRPIRIKEQIDKTIIAGFKITLAGQTIDATVNKKLESLKDQVNYE